MFFIIKNMNLEQSNNIDEQFDMHSNGIKTFIKNMFVNEFSKVNSYSDKVNEYIDSINGYFGIGQNAKEEIYLSTCSEYDYMNFKFSLSVENQINFINEQIDDIKDLVFKSISKSYDIDKNTMSLLEQKNLIVKEYLHKLLNDTVQDENYNFHLKIREVKQIVRSKLQIDNLNVKFKYTEKLCCIENVASKKFISSSDNEICMKTLNNSSIDSEFIWVIVDCDDNSLEYRGDRIAIRSLNSRKYINNKLQLETRKIDTDDSTLIFLRKGKIKLQSEYDGRYLNSSNNKLVLSKIDQRFNNTKWEITYL